MSDQPAESTQGAGAEAASEAAGIIQQMQTLVDVETGLADAHMAVKGDAAPREDTEEQEHHLDADLDDVDGFMGAAEEVEGALESAIPDPPPPSTTAETQLPGFGSVATTTAPPATVTADVSGEATSSAAVTEAEHAIDAVNADIPEPVLPEQVTEPAHDVVMETAIEEETSPMQIDTNEPPIQSAQVHTQGPTTTAPTEDTGEIKLDDDDDEEDLSRPRYDPSEPQEPTYVPTPVIAQRRQVETPAEAAFSVNQSIEDEQPATVKYDPSEPQTQAPIAYDPSEPQTQAPIAYDPSEPQTQAPIAYDPSIPQQSALSDAQPDQDSKTSVTQEPNGLPASTTSAAFHGRTQDPPVPHPVEPVNVENAVSPSFPSEIHSTPPSGRPLADLPTDITDESPSVVANQGLINMWRMNTSDTHALLGLFDWSVQKSEVNDARAWYAVIAKDSPTAYQPLLSLIRLEQALNNFTRVEKLFSDAIKGPSGGITAAADIEIWKSYLHYIRRQNPVVEGSNSAGDTRATITQAYDYALSMCGTDRESGEIWQEYIEFLASPKPANEWEEQQKHDALRKTYQKAVCIPLNNVEGLWKAYDAFENGVSKQTAKRFLAERSPAYMTARTALRELRQLTDVLPRPVIPPTPNFSDNDRGVVAQWKNYLKWEEGNPLVIEDKTALASRTSHALRKCLGAMRHYPELWQYAANHYQNAGDSDEAIAVLKAGIQACPKSVLLTFAYNDAEEQRKNLKQCHDAFEMLLSNLSTEVEELKKTVEAEVELARGPEIPNAPKTDDDDTEVSAEVTRMIEEREARGKLVQAKRGKEVGEMQVAISVVWIMYMRFARRSEGIKSARGIFAKSRKSPHLTWHTFEASAMMEYHGNKDATVATKIFAIASQRFPSEVDFLIRHIQFLLSINDDTNARAVFEKAILNIPADKARPLWDTWARYEYMHGDLAAVTKLENRFAETFPNDSPLKRFAQRFTYNGIDQIAQRDLGFNARTRAAAQAPPPPPQHHQMPPASFPPHPMNSGNAPPPPNAAQFQLPPSPVHKRPAPSRSPPPGVRGKPRISRSPSFDQGPGANKRYRPSPSYDRPPPPPPRDLRDRYDERDRDRDFRRDGPPPPRNRYPSGGGPPPPPAGPPSRSSLPPSGPVGGSPVPPGPNVQLDPSGLTSALTWFIGRLPSNRSFDGPTFRSEDIVGLFERHIGVSGTGNIPAPSRPAPGYNDPAPRYPPPTMGARRY